MEKTQKAPKGTFLSRFGMKTGKDFNHFDFKVWKRVWILQKRMWTTEARPENNGCDFRQQLRKRVWILEARSKKAGTGKLHILVGGSEFGEPSRSPHQTFLGVSPGHLDRIKLWDALGPRAALAKDFPFPP